MVEEKFKHLDNPFIDNGQKQTMVDMKGNCKHNCLLQIKILLCVCVQM